MSKGSKEQKRRSGRGGEGKEEEEIELNRIKGVSGARRGAKVKRVTEGQGEVEVVVVVPWWRKRSVAVAITSRTDKTSGQECQIRSDQKKPNPGLQ